jgi:hypothetical protein
LPFLYWISKGLVVHPKRFDKLITSLRTFGIPLTGSMSAAGFTLGFIKG